MDIAAVPITAAPHSGPKCFTIRLNTNSSFLLATSLLDLKRDAGAQYKGDESSADTS